MASNATREEIFYIMRAERENYEAGREGVSKPCPRCGKALQVKPLENGARNIRCIDDKCIDVSFRGL